ncbi:EamA family transporter [Luteimonas mephitis]|uniref:EamA family transporter n=1 Tax=Luteimonas mephitis TaxID=83615 RepID=UPI003A8DABC8
MGYLFVAITIALTVYGQLVIKWQVDLVGPSINGSSPLSFYLQLLLNPWVLSGLAAAFAASLSWMAALSKLPLSHAYPLTALSFVLVVVCGATLFAEPLGRYQLIGVALIVAGIAVGVQS